MGRYFFMSEDEWDLFDKDVKTIKEAGERIVCAVYRLKDKLAAVESENAELRKLTAILPDLIAMKKINDDLSDLKVNLSITEEMRDAVTGRLAVAVADFKSLEVKLAEANVTIKQQAHLQSSPPESSGIDTGDIILCVRTGQLSKVGYVDGDWLVLCDFWRRVRLFECKLHTKAAPEDRRALLMQMAKMVPVNEPAMYARGRIDHEDRDLQSNLTEEAVASLRSRADTRSAPEPENVAEHPDHWDGDPFCHVDMLEIKE